MQSQAGVSDTVPAWKKALLFVAGAGYEFANDMLFNIPGAAGLNGWTKGMGDEFNAGRDVGAAGALAVGSSEAEAGLAAITGGGAACLSGVGCVIGAPATAVGAVAAGVGTAQAAAATTYVAKKTGTGGSSGSSGNGGYQAPNGGGGVTSEVQVGDTTVSFGHGGRHLEGTGLTAAEVNQVIADDVAQRNLGEGQSLIGRITVGDLEIEYRAFGRGNNTVHVGTYYVP